MWNRIAAGVIWYARRVMDCLSALADSRSPSTICRLSLPLFLLCFLGPLLMWAALASWSMLHTISHCDVAYAKAGPVQCGADWIRQVGDIVHGLGVSLYPLASGPLLAMRRAAVAGGETIGMTAGSMVAASVTSVTDALSHKAVGYAGSALGTLWIGISDGIAGTWSWVPDLGVSQWLGQWGPFRYATSWITEWTVWMLWILLAVALVLGVGYYLFMSLPLILVWLCCKVPYSLFWMGAYLVASLGSIVGSLKDMAGPMLRCLWVSVSWAQSLSARILAYLFILLDPGAAHSAGLTSECAVPPAAPIVLPVSAPNPTDERPTHLPATPAQLLHPAQITSPAPAGPNPRPSTVAASQPDRVSRWQRVRALLSRTRNGPTGTTSQGAPPARAPPSCGCCGTVSSNRAGCGTSHPCRRAGGTCLNGPAPPVAARDVPQQLTRGDSHMSGTGAQIRPGDPTPRPQVDDPRASRWFVPALMAARKRADSAYCPLGSWATRLDEAPAEWAAFVVSVAGQQFIDAVGCALPTWDDLAERVRLQAIASNPPDGIMWTERDAQDPAKPSAAAQERMLGIENGAQPPPGLEPLMWWANYELGRSSASAPTPGLATCAAPGQRTQVAPLVCASCRQALCDPRVTCSRCRRGYHAACARLDPVLHSATSLWSCPQCAADSPMSALGPGSGPTGGGPHSTGPGPTGTGNTATTTPSSPVTPAVTPTDGVRGTTSARGASVGPGLAVCSQALLAPPPADLASRVLAATPPTTLHIPGSALKTVSRFVLLALTSLAWQLADGVDLPQHNMLEVGMAIITQHPARAHYLRERAALLCDAKWVEALELVQHQRAVDRRSGLNRDRRDPERHIRRARQCMQEGAVSRAMRAIEAHLCDAASPPDPDPACVRWLFPPEDRTGLDPDVCPPIAPCHMYPRGQALTRSADRGSGSRLPAAPPNRVRDWWVQHARLTSGGNVPDPEPTDDAASSRLLRPEFESRLAELSDDPFWPAIARSLARGSRMSAPGPSGLRSEHLIEVLGHKALAREIADALTCVLSYYHVGAIPSSSVDNRLFLQPKPSGGVRPIGARERLTSLAARLAAGPLRDELEGPACEMGQLGLSAAGTHRVAARLHRAVLLGHHIISMDVKNAFNAVSRRAVLHELPGDSAARPIAVALYGTACHYRPAQGDAIQATAGVVQGDPLAALLFANAMARIMHRARERTRIAYRIDVVPSAPVHELPPAATMPPGVDGFYVSFADDSYVIAPSLSVAERYARSLQVELGRVGLELANGRDKTAVLRALTRPDADYSSEWLSTWVAETTSLRCLGVPLGQETEAGWAEVRAAVAGKVDESAKAVLALTHLRHPQFLMTGLRLAGSWSRCEYMLSQVPAWAVAPDACDTLAAADVEVLAAALCTYAQGLTDACDGPRALVEATLPLKMGGLGLRWAPHELDPARAAASDLITGLERGDDLRRAKRQQARSRHDALTGIARGLEARDLDGCVARLERDATLIPIEATHLARRKVLSADGGLAGAPWTYRASKTCRTLMVDDEAATALAMRLGLPVYDGHTLTQCPANCSTRAALDGFGWHTAGCSSANKSRERRAVATAQDCLTGNHFRLLREKRCGEDGAPMAADEGVGTGVDGDLVVVRPTPGTARYTYIDFGSESLQAADPRQWVHTAEGTGKEPSQAAYAEKLRAAPRIRRTGALCSPVGYTPLGHIDSRSVRTLRDMACEADVADEVTSFRATRCDRIIPTIVCEIVGATAAAVLKTRKAMNLPSLAIYPLRHEAIQELVLQTNLTRTDCTVAGAA